MNYPIMTICWSFTSIYALWVLYLAVMNLKRARDAGTLKPAAKVFGYPLLFCGLTLDALVNLIPYSIILLELPLVDIKGFRNNWRDARSWYTGEWTVSQRTKRWYHSEDESYRKTVAVWIGDNLLNDFDPSGKHV